MKRLCLLLCLALLIQASAVSLAEDVGAVVAEDVEAPDIAVEPLPGEVGELDLLSQIEGTDPELAGVKEFNAAEADTTTEEAPVTEADFAVPKALTLGVKEKFTLEVPGATFDSSKKSVASVSGAGVVKGKKKGSAVIRVLVDGEEVGRCAVKVLPAPKKVTLSAEKLTLTVGDTARLKVKLPRKTASNRLTWSSGNKSVATVDAEGVVTAVGEGKAKITVETFNGKKASCTVAVFGPDAPRTLTLGVKTLSLGVKESVMVIPQVNEGAAAAFKWSSKSGRIAKVSQKGVITGKKRGTTKIAVRTQNGLKATLTVKVKKAPSKVTVSPKKATVAVGGAVRVKAKLPKDAASQIFWESGNTGVAVVSQDGTVFGCQPGTARITCWTYNGKKATCVVTVAEGSGEDQALREKLLDNWGEWQVTEVVAGGIRATTCGRFFTLNLKEDNTCYLMVHHGRYAGGEDLYWTICDGMLLVLDGTDALALKPDGDVKRLAFTVDGTTMYFTQGIDPDPYYYAKQNTTPEDVNGKWVADKVSIRSEGLTFRAEDIGYQATLEIQGEKVRLRFPRDGGVEDRTMEVWYPGSSIDPLESEDREIASEFYYLPSLDNMRCRLLPTTENNVDVYFRRAKD